MELPILSCLRAALGKACDEAIASAPRRAPRRVHIPGHVARHIVQDHVAEIGEVGAAPPDETPAPLDNTPPPLDNIPSPLDNTPPPRDRHGNTNYAVAPRRPTPQDGVPSISGREIVAGAAEIRQIPEIEEVEEFRALPHRSQVRDLANPTLHPDPDLTLKP